MPGREGENCWKVLRYPIHLFSRNDAPIGESPEIRKARSPGASIMFCVGFTMPEVGTTVPRGIVAALPVASLTSFHPVIFTGAPAFEATAICTYSVAGFEELAFETYPLIVTAFR